MPAGVAIAHSTQTMDDPGSMTLMLALIATPMLVAAALFCFRAESFRRWIVWIATAAIAAGTVAIAVFNSGSNPGALPFDPHQIHIGMLAVEGTIALFLIYIGIRMRRPLIAGLAVVQSAIMLWFEYAAGGGLQSGTPLLADNLSILMALINGLIGGGICVYAVGYMREYHAGHSEVRDRRPFFFALLFVFVGAMFGLIFANNLLWLFFFWEITTLCSFLLIGYTRTEEAKRNALRALAMNLAGGVAFALAIVICHRQAGTIELQALIESKQALVLLPAALLCFAGITKSAQLPFSGWLLGAMVAPTPVSALLHSSTMVKAGVYLVLRMAPVIAGTSVGLMVGTVGGVTFLIGSLAAITTSDAKKVLAWSTVANLGLIVLCGGVGTGAAVWAGVLLIIFHAVAKCLLFLCVGVVEHRLHSRDIEAMCGLIAKLPHLASMMLIGMAGMFLAPFGMLISKWAVLEAVVDAYPVLSVFVVFGSAATLFFWVKWMGKLLEVLGAPGTGDPAVTSSRPLPADVPGMGVLYGLSAATFLTCLLFPVISSRMIEPWVAAVFGQRQFLSQGNVVIMMIMMAVILLFPIGYLVRGRKMRVTHAYLGGANLQSSVRFIGGANQAQTVEMGNYYLRNFFSEPWLFRWGVASCAALLVLMILMAARL